MSENQPYEPGQTPQNSQPPQQPQQPPAQPLDWRDERRREREEWREERREWRDQHHSGRGAWIWGAFLILLGVIFLLDNIGPFHLANWWALFILLPAVGCFQEAWNRYQAVGNRLDSSARGSLIGGFIITLVALIFLFGMNFGLLWPILLVVAGAGLLLNALLPG